MFNGYDRLSFGVISIFSLEVVENLDHTILYNSTYIRS